MAGEAGKDAAVASKDAASLQRQTDKEVLAFQEKVYADQQAIYEEWKAIYGPIEQNLANFYSSLSPDTFVAAGLEYNAKEFQKAQEQTLTTLAQRGLETSGLTASTTQQTNMAKAEANATVRRDAPFKVAEAKQGFLSQGKGGPTQGPSGNNVSNAMSALGTNQAMFASQQAQLAQSNANSLWGSAGSLLSTGLNYYGQNRPYTANAGSTVDPNFAWEQRNNFEGNV